ncbi:hypothetical protein PG996_005047 [Apiospora saccharicola]|uniref:BZIP domain-containing protein n=1 Tax=Apiospora saccharicola TaxID=335842 RepID=A0ABR1VKD8_9PEZI
MPRKVRVPADREANRKSQQQARQRQREYVASLEKRLAEHESRGVQATIEVQKAARVVAATNEKLLALLRIHGVQDAEIDAFLRDPIAVEQNVASAASHGAFDPAAHSRSGSQRSVVSAAGVPTGQRLSEMHPLPAPQSRETSSINPPQLGAQPSSKIPGCGTLLGETGGCEQKVDACHASPLTQPALGKSHELPGQETSCDTAAGILSEVHGLDDLSKARTFLGCTTRGPCSVRNMRLFELMDRQD